MPKASRTGSDKLSALIAEIETEAYSRGQADARKELLDALGSGGVRASTSEGYRADEGRKRLRRRNAGRADANALPGGSVPRFVEQALRDRPGLTPPDILERAVTDMERLIKPPSILTELRNGRRQGRYELSGGRWSLAAPDPGAAAADETASPEATQDSEPGEGESEATPGLNL